MPLQIRWLTTHCYTKRVDVLMLPKVHNLIFPWYLLRQPWSESVNKQEPSCQHTAIAKVTKVMSLLGFCKWRWWWYQSSKPRGESGLALILLVRWYEATRGAWRIRGEPDFGNTYIGPYVPPDRVFMGPEHGPHSWKNTLFCVIS